MRPNATIASFAATALLFLGGRKPTAADPTPADLAPRGERGRGLAVLFLSLSPELDPTYTNRLAADGIAFAAASLWEPLRADFLRRFDTIVLDSLPPAAAQYDTFGQRMIYARANLDRVWDCLTNGAGVLVYGDLSETGAQGLGGWNDEMRRWGAQLQQACVLDPGRAITNWLAYGTNQYAWTENLAKHPATEGLRRLYYPSANLRWDDIFTAPPLLVDGTWTALVRAMTEARAAFFLDREWFLEPATTEPPLLAAARTAGRGRLAVFAISSGYTHRLGCARLATNWRGEMCYGPMDDIILRRGDGVVPSDTERFVSSLYRWLGANAQGAGLGGYRQNDLVALEPVPHTDEERAFAPVLDFDHLPMPPSWRHRPTHVQVAGKSYFPEFPDPFVAGELRFLKGLIGPRTALSTGSGSVADYAAAARSAGYSLVVFAEDFEALSASDWDQLVQQCDRATADDLVCLPGFDIVGPADDHFLIVAPPYYPRAPWLTPDGKRLAKPQMINLPYYNHIVIAHRVAGSPLPQERLKHFQGLTVFTYRDGKLVDDARAAYAWQVMNASHPHPIVVHEIFSPREVARSSAAGYQQILPGDTPRGAAAYFRAGIHHYFEAPARYLVSEGPLVTALVLNPKDFGPASENRLQFRVDVAVRADAPLASVTLYDGSNVVRRWLPDSTHFAASAHFRHNRQYGLYVVAEDGQGRRVITDSMRTVPPRFHFRCSDRQNWLGHVAAYYTGTDLPARMGLHLPVKGTDEGSGLFTATPGACMAAKLSFPFSTPDVVLTETTLDEKYRQAVFKDVGYDAMPSLPAEPSTVYAGRVRTWSFTPAKAGQPYPMLFDVDLTLRRDVEPRAPAGLFPSFGAVRGAQVAWFDAAAGRLVTGAVPRDAVLDVPAGGLAGGFVALTPGLRLDNGQFGLAPADTNASVRRAGTRLQARFLIAGTHGVITKEVRPFDENPEAWLRAMGFGGKLPYSLALSRGALEGVRYVAALTPKDGSVAGEVARTADLPFAVPLELAGLNPRWPAGIWRPDAGASFSGVFEGRAWPLLDVGKPGPFVAGSLMTATASELVLEVVTWTKDRVRVEVHNPTDRPISATVMSAAGITDLKPLRADVTLQAGSTAMVSASPLGWPRPQSTGH